MLRQGANPDITNSMGETPLHQAADNSNMDLARLLLTYRANPNLQQNDGDSPLHHAAFRGDCEMVALLLENGANPNLLNYMVNFMQFGRSPLHYAVDSACCRCVKLLIDQGADPNLEDKQGKSPNSAGINESLIAALNSTPAVESYSEIFSNSFSYPKEENPTSQNATNFISDIGGESAMFDTFGNDKLIKVIKPASLKPIWNWLKEINLEELYEVMCDAGYDDIKVMTTQMIGPLPIVEQDLIDSGIVKPGHRVRIILRLKQDAGILPKLKSKKFIENSNFFQCCLLANNATRNMQTTSLSEWLEGLGAGAYYQSFVDTGFDHYETLILMLATGLQVNCLFFEEIGVKNKDLRKKIQKKLEKDLERFYSTSQSVNISYDEPKTVACDSCLLF